MWQPRSVLHLVGANMVEEPTEMILEPAEYGGITCVGNGVEQQQEFYVVERVPYEFQRGGNQMLRVTRAARTAGAAA